MRKKLDNID